MNRSLSSSTSIMRPLCPHEIFFYGTPLTSSPADFDTLTAFFRDTQTTPADYDLVLTGDLGALGHAIVRDFFSRDGIDLGEHFQDCGLLLFDRKRQDMHAGASG